MYVCIFYVALIRVFCPCDTVIYHSCTCSGPFICLPFQFPFVLFILLFLQRFFDLFLFLRNMIYVLSVLLFVLHLFIYFFLFCSGVVLFINFRFTSVCVVFSIFFLWFINFCSSFFSFFTYTIKYFVYFFDISIFHYQSALCSNFILRDSIYFIKFFSYLCN